ncbi:ecto-ADP-ribosyltransferase 4-like isoform X2 [Mugil cephalus]|uniref:ecto-ADP-ribosyltransferase 4-like isoform X2 n=1 Tax=Mugil cephalus TaxID=48193 RepID=UPI001FB695A4|nr:ecto-ADP-ribosyltransferase 4-like isoform X2 [Mugil cephalus]
MPSWEKQACQKIAISRAIIFIVLLSSTQDVTYDPTDNSLGDDTFEGCKSRATVVTDEDIMQRWDTCSRTFTQAWSNAKQNVSEPMHEYMEKRHSFALYMYTNIMLQSVKQMSASAERNVKQKATFEPHSLYSSLSEAIQILKHSQVMCLSTSYRTETVLHLNTSNKQVRFNTFILGSDERNFTGNASCFELHSCFGADITHYSALKQKNQVLIPPYEVFKVTHTQTGTKSCEVIYRLESNLNCVYDRDSNMLHPISPLPVERFWLIFTIICIVIIFIVIPFVIRKVFYKKTTVYRPSYLQSSTSTNPHWGAY